LRLLLLVCLQLLLHLCCLQLLTHLLQLLPLSTKVLILQIPWIILRVCVEGSKASCTLLLLLLLLPPLLLLQKPLLPQPGNLLLPLLQLLIPLNDILQGQLPASRGGGRPLCSWLPLLQEWLSLLWECLALALPSLRGCQTAWRRPLPLLLKRPLSLLLRGQPLTWTYRHPECLTRAQRHVSLLPLSLPLWQRTLPLTQRHVSLLPLSLPLWQRTLPLTQRHVSLLPLSLPLWQRTLPLPLAKGVVCMLPLPLCLPLWHASRLPLPLHHGRLRLRH
jgi:hypothetical protein